MLEVVLKGLGWLEKKYILVIKCIYKDVEIVKVQTAQF